MKSIQTPFSSLRAAFTFPLQLLFVIECKYDSAQQVCRFLKKGSRKGIKRDLLTYNHNSVLNGGQFSEAVVEEGEEELHCLCYK